MIEILKNSPSQKTRVILSNKITFKAKGEKKPQALEPYCSPTYHLWNDGPIKIWTFVSFLVKWITIVPTSLSYCENERAWYMYNVHNGAWHILSASKLLVLIIRTLW